MVSVRIHPSFGGAAVGATKITNDRSTSRRPARF